MIISSQPGTNVVIRETGKSPLTVFIEHPHTKYVVSNE